MNICLRIFVVFALIAAISCGKQTNKSGSTKVLSGGYSTAYPANYFYNSLLSLPLEDAIAAIKDGDHNGIMPCPLPSKGVKCDPYSPWRTYDGFCNNLKFSWWGASYTPFKRLYQPAYEKNDKPRYLGKSGYPLTNPRTISLEVHYPHDVYIDISALFSVFGQYVNHDLSHIGEIKNKDGTLLRCKCGKKAAPDCMNTPIPPNDYYNKDKKCLTQARSRPSYPEFNCVLPHREQINEVTSYLDLSQVYGNNKQQAYSLRSFKYGRLKTSSFEGLDEEFLPTGCKAYQLTKNICFKAGDSRVNQYPMLTAQHTIWVREHNRIADALRKLNPYWSDELLYQTARTINIAEYQAITYYEFLPILVGKQFHKIFQLGLEKPGEYFMGYDVDLLANVANEYATAAGRYGHVLTVPYETQMDSYFNVYKNHSLWEVMFNPKLLLYKNALDGFMRGAISYPGNWFSTHFTDYLNNDVTVDQGPYNPSTGHSLSTLNIQRGRDHGLGSYNYYRVRAGLPRAKTWDDLTYIPKKVIYQLQEVYECPDDIDLFTGGTAEYPLPDGVVGPTFAYILARGFRDWKYGDRWYFENGQDEYTRFPINQLDELRQASLARIICDNTGITHITQNPLLVESEYNKIVRCDTLPTVNLKLWKDYGPSKDKPY